MTEEQPGYAERDDDEFTEQTGGGADWEDNEELDEDADPAPDQGADWDAPDDAEDV
jgi:hypothetical protein